jgi:Protein of unknown function (DUF1214)
MGIIASLALTALRHPWQRAVSSFRYKLSHERRHRTMLGPGSFYFGTFRGSKGGPLESENIYRLHVPANVPVFDFLLYTVYSLRTSGFFPNSTALRSVHSTRTDKNSDGSGAIDMAASGPKPRRATRRRRVKARVIRCCSRPNWKNKKGHRGWEVSAWSSVRPIYENGSICGRRGAAAGSVGTGAKTGAPTDLGRLP